MIIGLTGTNGAGKTVTADYLKSKGFEFHSLSDEIRAEVERVGAEPTRERLIAMGNQLRAEFGPAVLAERIRTKLRLDRNYVIDSIRNPYEVAALKRASDFHLLHLDAPIELRYERARERGGARMPASFEEFAEQEQRETASNDPNHQQLRACQDLADERMINDTDLPSLNKKLDELMLRWMMHSARPGWDAYFMQIAGIVALRSNCIKRKVAAVIVKDKRIVSTGYNGTPRGVKNCNEGGCPRCAALGPSGEQLGECLCSHAEENAIVQAAYHGISLQEASIYTTFSPCLICTKMIINAGIREVVYHTAYSMNDIARDLLQQARVRVRQLAES